MSSTSGFDVIEYAWRHQRIWSLTANHLKASIDRARNLALALGITGAVMATLAAQVEGMSRMTSRALAVSAGLLVGALPLASRGASTRAVSDWTRARSASEGLKTEVYSYLAGGSRYVRGDRQRELRNRSRKIIAAVADLLPHAASVQPDSKPVPSVSDVDSYLEQRVAQQVDGYYRPMAALYRERITNLRRAEWVLSLVAVALGALAGAGGVKAAGAWIPVATTVAAAVAAHISAARYQQLVIEYLRTADQLDYVQSSWRDQGLSDSQFIDACGWRQDSGVNVQRA